MLTIFENATCEKLKYLPPEKFGDPPAPDRTCFVALIARMPFTGTGNLAKENYTLQQAPLRWAHIRK